MTDTPMTKSDVSTLKEQLRNGRQCDPEGIMCEVSRQACHGAADLLDALALQPEDPRIGELEAANAEQSKLIAEYELEVKERGCQNRAQTEEISRLSNQLKDRDAQVLALREALVNLLGAVDDHGVEYWDDDMLPDSIEAIIAASDTARAALTSTEATANTIAAKIRADERERCAQEFDRLAEQADKDARSCPLLDDRARAHHYRAKGECMRAAATVRTLSNKEGE